MKETKDVVCLIADYGYFPSLAEALSHHYKKVYYYSPTETEFKDINRCVIADGLPNVERLDNFLAPERLKEIDLFVFPDLDFGSLQQHLKSLGKAVWGSMGGSDVEMSRSKFLKFVDEIGLPVAKSKVITGLTALSDYLKEHKDCWVKLNKFRAQQETFYHQDYAHTARTLEKLAYQFGSTKELITFVVQDHIETPLEIGYDGWTVDGQYPVQSFAGYELKNELYLGSLLDYSDLPEQVQQVNSALAPYLKKIGYRNFMSTEIRIKDGTPYFIDPTMRCAGLTMEHQQENCLNLGDVIWHGANGEMIIPKFKHKFAAEATLHYSGEGSVWKTITVPDKVRQWIKLSNFCAIDGAYHFPPADLDELGVVIGLGDTVEESIEHLKSNLGELSDEPVYIHTEGFIELLDTIRSAEKEGIKFSDDPIPTEADHGSLVDQA